jgi:hypothetical protein
MNAAKPVSHLVRPFSSALVPEVPIHENIKGGRGSEDNFQFFNGDTRKELSKIY